MSARNSPFQLSFFIFNTPFIYFCLLGYLLVQSIMGTGMSCQGQGHLTSCWGWVGVYGFCTRMVFAHHCFFFFSLFFLILPVSSFTLTHDKFAVGTAPILPEYHTGT